MRARSAKALAVVAACVAGLAPVSAGADPAFPVVSIVDGNPKCWAPQLAPPLAEVQAGSSCSVPVGLSTLSPAPVGVKYRTVPLDHPPADYVPVQEAQLVFQPGATRATALIPLVPKPPLPQERFILELYAPAGAALGRARAEVTIMTSAR
jgi:hypothetical protein